MHPRIVAGSDASWLVVFDARISAAAGERVRRLASWLSSEPIDGVVDLAPAYASILVRFDPRRVAAAEVEAALGSRLAHVDERELPPGRLHVIPVTYGGEDGPDLPDVARAAGLTEAGAIALHAGAIYEVRFLGFTPGFPYLAGLPARLAAPRLRSPRPRVPAGSVAIAGGQAGIYPSATPGGWRIVGRTTAVLFDPRATPPAALAPGDRVRFVPAGGR